MALNWFAPKQGVRRRSLAEAAEQDSIFSGASVGPGTDASLAWPEVVRQLGQEVTMSLNAASEQLERLNRLEPSLVRSLVPITESVERARQAGMAAQHVLRLCEDPPPQHREVLNLADVVRAVLTARGDWLKRRQVSVRQGLTQTQVFADSSMLYMLVDELVQWAGHMTTHIAVAVDKSRTTSRPRLRVSAWCDPAQVPDALWRGMRWTLWHQLARTLGAVSRLDMRDDHLRVTLSLAPVTDQQLTAAVEDSAGLSSVSAVIRGCRVLIISANAQRRAQCLQALGGYGLVLDIAEDMQQAERLALQHPPDALVHDASVNDGAIDRLRDQLHARSGTPAAAIEIHDQGGTTDFHASTVGSVSTGHVAAGALNQSLGPALVFELCKMM
ncbi:hypothetical protein [Ottowia testudinis]|uniref:Uncharacterized protein n=1 Tax=Ottowia testudinis TaxID=2816950 RepID=A0A975CFE5_9BURK|nr:hypothetical protein [Ottowia testudinis]QTD44081.1 hypothetical protein J1M35_13180 [Ottowia testudinis]